MRISMIEFRPYFTYFPASSISRTKLYYHPNIFYQKRNVQTLADGIIPRTVSKSNKPTRHGMRGARRHKDMKGLFATWPRVRNVVSLSENVL